jgi:epoxyqueuosine reductase
MEHFSMTNSKANELTEKLKSKAFALGFDFVGIAKAKRLEEDGERLASWLEEGKHAEMAYMGNHFEKRIDPRKLVEGTKSVVSFLYNYHSKKEQRADAPKIAKYAYGKDYHFVIKKKLHDLMAYLKEEEPLTEGRVFVDSAPVLDRAWARESGLGWIGKNSMLINKQRGSDFFIGSMMLNLELIYDSPIKDYCGNCTRCLDSCPTDAITPDRSIDSNRCISYLTIELKSEKIPEEFADQLNGWAFGCDICQDVCPWNRFAREHTEEEFEPKA